MEISYDKLKEMLEQAFEGGREYGSTCAYFNSTDSVSRYEYDNVADVNEIVSDILKPYNDFNV